MKSLSEKLRNYLNGIPEGEVRTYRDVAKELGIHPRHAAILLSKNDASRAPCYKIIRSDGTIGGYSAGDGVKTKIKLLEGDGITMENDRIDLEKYGA